MRNSIAQERFGAIIQLQPLPWDDSPINVQPVRSASVTGRIQLFDAPVTNTYKAVFLRPEFSLYNRAVGLLGGVDLVV